MTQQDIITKIQSQQNQTDKFTLILDSSQIVLFLDCNEKWNLADRQLLKSKTPSQPREAMLMGSLGHLYFDIYYKQIASGLNFALAIENALRTNVDEMFCACGHSVIDHQSFHDGQLQVGKCEEEICHCAFFTAKEFELEKDLRTIVKERCREYTYFYNATLSDFTPLGPDSVEVGFSHKLYEDNEKLFILEGRIDLLGSYRGIECIVDHKFQKSAHDLYKKSIQFKNYAYAAGVNTLFVNYIRFANAKETTFKRDIANFTQMDHMNWKVELLKIYHKIANIIMYEGGVFEKNWAACGGRFGYVCDFVSLCEERNQDLVQIRKENNFEKKTPYKVW